MKFRAAQEAALQQSTIVGGTQSVRWRARKKRPWLEKDQKDNSWMEPMFEFLREKEAAAGKEPEGPAALHVVRRIKPLKGRPWWEKRIMERLGLDTKLHEPVIHKNTPAMNRLLEDIKHLVQIQPLRLPDGLPTDPRDFPNTVLTSDGRLLIRRPTLDPLSVSDADSPAEEGEKDKWHLQLDTIKRDLRRRMDNYTINAEYVETKHSYTFNQDGKEYRYTRHFNSVPKKDGEGSSR